MPTKIPIQLDAWLQTLGGTCENSRFVLPGEDLQPAADMIAPLTHYGFVLTEGPDSSRFLQGQTTCNINEINDTQATPGALCSPKGRVVSDFLIGQISSDGYLMRLRRTLADSMIAALSKYIVFSKAEQQNVSDAYVALGMRGETAMHNIEKVFGARPGGRYQQLHRDGATIIVIDDEQPLAECWLKIDQIEALWPSLSEGLTLRGSSSWESLTIRLGRAEIEPECSGEFIPQMLNLQLTDAINFNKGCYTGQEVVARMQYKGSVKRRLYRLAYEGSPLPSHTPLFCPGSEQSIGNLVNSAAIDANHCEALAVITIKNVEAGFAIVDENGRSFEVLSLPYAIT